MPKKRKFLGRTNELKQLNNLKNKRSSSFVAVKGRRRIGKSRLISEFGKSFDHFYKLEGIAPIDGLQPNEQLAEFNRQISRVFNIPNGHYQDFSDAFWAIGERLKKGKILLFFDELSWLGSHDASFLSKLKSFWDNHLSHNPELIFVVCSSASSWIESNLLSSTAFVGRISLTLTLGELSLSESCQFWPKGIDLYEKIKVLCITGGIPRYLEEVISKETAEQNIQRMCFTPGSILLNEFEQIFSDLFLRNSHFYKKIVHLLASGAKEIREIQSLISENESAEHYGRLPEYLTELEQAGFIQRDYTWSIKTGHLSKLSRYRLKDNYLRFYLRYIEKNFIKIKNGLFLSKQVESLPEWNTILGLQFENLVLNNRAALHKVIGINPNDIVSENPYFQRPNSRQKGCQIDYLIQTKQNTLYVCEIKFSKNPLGTSVIEEMENKLAALSYPKGVSYRTVLIHVNGISDSLVDDNFFTHIVGIESLVRGETSN